MAFFDTDRGYAQFNGDEYRGPLGELITPGEKIYLGTKMEKKEYLSKAEMAETEKEFFDLGFSKYRMPDKEETVIFSNFKGDRIVYDTKKKTVISRDISDPDVVKK